MSNLEAETEMRAANGVADGRAAVRVHLIARLDEAGLTRPGKITAGAFDKLRGRMVDALAYMAPENLMTLAEVLIDLSPDGVWPGEVIWRTQSRAIQMPPPAQSRIVSSWLASVEGPRADAGGYLAELYRWLVAHRRPPLDWDMRQIRGQAEENRRRADLIRDRISRNVAVEDDRRWLSGYLSALAEARAIVVGGAQ
ncbi:MAG: hypothetical protein Q4G24_10720 [Paracoccus sp. (in: a-proteobacteria)]|uniref:hypothetical protein n=1 Tax=Paracoccus sp. TaxID=267 RepID=UPI0026E0E495|nr:hypothetical protein [Paracoccus sp. (in: a-proteobacteria)]MDO5621931.1 hypothetical protein [Paracoccus sp. (in: a-proteobacteria)]